MDFIIQFLGQSAMNMMVPFNTTMVVPFNTTMVVPFNTTMVEPETITSTPDMARVVSETQIPPPLDMVMVLSENISTYDSVISIQLPDLVTIFSPWAGVVSGYPWQQGMELILVIIMLMFIVIFK